MRGRVFAKATVQRFEFAYPADVERIGNGFLVWNKAPSLSYPIIMRAELSNSHCCLRVGQMGSCTRLGSRRERPPAARKCALRDHLHQSVVSQGLCPQDAAWCQ